MKTRPPSFFSIISAGSLLLAVAHAAPAVPAPSTAPTAEPAKPYVLFMRTDVAVEQGKKLYPIKDVSGRNFIIKVNGQKVEVPMAGNPHNLEFKHGLTLARSSAALTGLECGRAYTPGRDPRMKRQREAVLADSILGDNASLAEGQYIKGLNKDFIALNTEPTNPDGTPNIAYAWGITQEWLRRSDQLAKDSLVAESQANELRHSEMTSGAFARLEAEREMAQELFDAVEVRFEISSPVYLEKPYLVVITRFRARDDKPGAARNAVYAKALDTIGSIPTKIDILHGGFPVGFEIEDLQVHLYNEGKEVPTNIAQNRVPLTRDEAFEYLKIEYLGNHKGETLVATPALGLPDKEERLRLTPNLWNPVYYAKVSKDGVPYATFADEACSQPVDDLVETLAQNVRYYPAIEKGKPVEGTARLTWSQLAL